MANARGLLGAVEMRQVSADAVFLPMARAWSADAVSEVKRLRELTGGGEGPISQGAICSGALNTTWEALCDVAAAECKFVIERDENRLQVAVGNSGAQVAMRDAMGDLSRAPRAELITDTGPCPDVSRATHGRRRPPRGSAAAARTEKEAGLVRAKLCALRTARRIRAYTLQHAPLVICIEQCDSIVTHFKPALRLLLRALTRLPYTWRGARAKAVDFGACHSRTRLLLTGSLKDEAARGLHARLDQP